MLALFALAVVSSAHSVQADLVLRSGAILVPAIVDGNPCRLILDTGMPETVIDPYVLAGRDSGFIRVQLPGSPEFLYDCRPSKQVRVAPETWLNDRKLGASGFLGLRQLRQMIVGVDLLTGEFSTWAAPYGQSPAFEWLRSDRSYGSGEPEKLALRLDKDYVYLNIKRAGQPKSPILDLGCDLSIDPPDSSGDRGVPVAQTSAFFPVGETHSVTVFQGADYSSDACTIRRLSTIADRDFRGPLFGWHAFSGSRMIVDVSHGEMWVRWRGAISTPVSRSLMRMGLAIDSSGTVLAAFGPAKTAGLQQGDTIQSVNGGALSSKDGGLEVAQTPDMTLALDRDLYSYLLLRVKKENTEKVMYLVLAPGKS